jgi:polysaccharide deacetylase 2 family uncharacterized protein YibQ
VSDEEPTRLAGIFASTRIRVLLGLSAVLALISASLLVVIATTDETPPLPVAAAPEGNGQTGPAAAPSAHAGAKPAEHAPERPADTGHPAAPQNGASAVSPQAESHGDPAHGGSKTAAVAPTPARSPQQAAAPVMPPAPPPLPPVGSDDVGALAPVPDPGLVEQSPDGLLPKIGVDGRQPWQVYARPFNPNESRPRVAVLLTSLGLSSAATESAIQGLPGGVTLSFQPYADNLQQWINLARAAGHEVLLNLPLEPLDYPTNDPGPQALFTALEPVENLERLNWALSRVTGYVGVATHMGSRFTTSREAMQPILQVLRQRGLLLVDTRSSARSVATAMATELGVPRAINDRFLDAREVSRTTIDARLDEVERIAREVGVSVAVGQAYPVTIERLRAWTQTLEGKELALAPVSAIINLQTDR